MKKLTSGILFLLISLFSIAQNIVQSTPPKIEKPGPFEIPDSIAIAISAITISGFLVYLVDRKGKLITKIRKTQKR